MGNKTKKGKQRLDVFYHAAKDSGYRARSAYKLIQLNKKYNILPTARVCIDLCAAPGSWMQVCTKFMPVSSVIVGVDLYKIANIPNTLSIQGDITTEKVRQDLKTSLKTWKADLVLHDGAPNVGTGWLHDAYQQNLLALHSFKLACEFLHKGGNFVTKVFRSKDHLSLQFVFRKLFKRVEATKPMASRFESAEIFVVCLGYLAPDKIDPAFFDPKYVFQTVEPESTTPLNYLKPEKKKAKAEGYEDGATMLFNTSKISEFLSTTTYIEMLEKTNAFEWDCEEAFESIHTTREILEFCKDIKVVGRKELRKLLKWRKHVNNEMKANQPEPEETKADDDKKTDSDEEEKDQIDDELAELEKIGQEINHLKVTKERETRQKRKKVERKTKRLEEKQKFRLMVPGDAGPVERDSQGLFKLKTLDNVDAVDKILDKDREVVSGSEDEDEKEEMNKWEYYSKGEEKRLNIKKLEHMKASERNSDSEAGGSDSSDDEMEGLNLTKDQERHKNILKKKIMEEEEKNEKNNKKKRVSFAPDAEGDRGSDGEDSGPDDDEKKSNPITTDLVGDVLHEKRERKAEVWFNKGMFEDLETDDLEDIELENAIEQHKLAGGSLMQKEPVAEPQDSTQQKEKEHKDTEFSAKDCPDSDSDTEADTKEDQKVETDSDSDSDSGVESGEEPVPKKRKKGYRGLNPVGLALATKMLHSKKSERDLYDEGFNRYMFDDTDVPTWFAYDEHKHNSKRIVVDREDLEMYEDRNKPVDGRTIKKVVEAKARKKRRALKKMTKARKKAENISNNEDMTMREKAVELKKVYKRALSSKKKDKIYLVMKKGFAGKRPKGAKGPTTMVDKRLKKDKRANTTRETKTKKGKARRSKSKK